ncbi:MAG TPA: DUF711 family protein [Anaerolineales bacterium]|nr:DUF711 family protein [Anaerolineales bacterium]
MPHKIIRTICVFTGKPSEQDIARLIALEAAFTDRAFTVQTRRLCSPDADGVFELDAGLAGDVFLSLGRLDFDRAAGILDDFLAAKNVAFNLDLTEEPATPEHAAVLFEIIARNAGKTFSFAYTFNTPPSSPYYPSAAYERNGFAIGLQSTDLSAGCTSIEEWLARVRETWLEIDGMMAGEAGYLGIDTSIAPLFDGPGSLLRIVKDAGQTFDEAVTSDTFLRISGFIKNAGPRNIGLCGLMFPCLEDFELANEYELANFSIERNVFLSLHSGLGIDAYPIGVDERPERVVQVLNLVRGLSNRYGKPLSVRFVSDGKAGIGERSDFGNPYLKDVTIRPL